MFNIEDAWENFLEFGSINENEIMNKDENVNINKHENVNINKDENENTIVNEYKNPKVSNIYISTKTIIAYFNRTIDLYEVFWDINLIDYSKFETGIIKKQMKFNFHSKEELNLIHEKMKREDKIIDEYIINQIDNPNGRIKYKDIRKITVGISNKDIISYRHKKKKVHFTIVL